MDFNNGMTCHLFSVFGLSGHALDQRPGMLIPDSLIFIALIFRADNTGITSEADAAFRHKIGG
jgi:hypothetical protein